MARVTVADYASRDKALLSSGRRDRSRQSLKQGWNQRLQIRTRCCPALLEPKAADDIRPPTTRVARAASATDEHFHAPWIRGRRNGQISSGSVVIGDEGRLASTGIRACFLILCRLTLLLRPLPSPYCTDLAADSPAQCGPGGHRRSARRLDRGRMVGAGVTLQAVRSLGTVAQRKNRVRGSCDGHLASPGKHFHCADNDRLQEPMAANGTKTAHPDLQLQPLTNTGQ
jgi:hypothetical protein